MDDRFTVYLCRNHPHELLHCQAASSWPTACACLARWMTRSPIALTGIVVDGFTGKTSRYTQAPVIANSCSSHDSGSCSQATSVAVATDALTKRVKTASFLTHQSGQGERP